MNGRPSLLTSSANSELSVGDGDVEVEKVEVVKLELVVPKAVVALLPALVLEEEERTIPVEVNSVVVIAFAVVDDSLMAVPVPSSD
jgi:hypothetical protein